MEIEKALKEIKEQMPGLKILENEVMADHCSFKSGGAVRALLAPQSINSLAKICCVLKENKVLPFILGNGTNVVFSDEGNSELVVISTENLQEMHMLDEGYIYAECGVSLARLAAFAQENGLTGLEFASGIPGTIGGGVMMNAGAYGGELKDTVDSVTTYYLPEQRLYEFTNEQCKFSYRHSVFQEYGGNFILNAVFKLEKGDKDEISEKMKELNEKRRSKQPLDLPSAGSAFKRPEGYYAAALIEECGLMGYTIGGAQVSEKHAGFIVNKGGASSRDLYELMDHVRRTVYEKKGVTLEPEIILLSSEYRLEDNSPPVPRNAVF